MKKARIKSLLILIGLIILVSAHAGEPIILTKPALKAIYSEPATDWTSTDDANTFIVTPQPLPLGNGYMGAMVFGGVESDLIQINEHTLWSGGPAANPSYDGGHRRTAAQNRQILQNVRQALQDKMTEFTATKFSYIDNNGKVVANDYAPESGQLKTNIESLMGDKTYFGSYQSLGNINIAYLSVTKPEVLLDKIKTDCDHPNNAAEGVRMLFDESAETKWYSDAGFKGLPCYISWEYNTPITVGSYTLVSGNDMQPRDPKSWKLYGSDNGENYTLIDTRTDITFANRKEAKEFTLSKTGTYKYFKFEITALHTVGQSPQLCDITLNTGTSSGAAYTNYTRTLDLDNATATVKYDENDVSYTREYFMSYPKNLMVIKLSANQTGKLSRAFWISTPQPNVTITAENNILTMTGKPSDHSENGLKFAQQIKIIPTNGTLYADGSRIIVENADEIILIMSAATNYLQCMDDTFNYFSAENPLDKVKANINTASDKVYAELLEEHKQDYKSLYDKMALSIDNVNSVPAKATNELLAGYKNGSNTSAENLYLEMLYYQFGRYLLISSSRKNTLPANLQGVWADGLNPPWSADYHTNINLQMNYWLAQQTNLSECHLPMIKYAESLVPRGKQTAQRYYCKQDGSDVRGWVIHHENNVWGNTAPGVWYEGFYFPAGAAWVCQDIWEYYQFNSDKEFLRNHYNTMLDAALFWVDNLWKDARDGSLVANPSYSPEHGGYSLGASCDQAIIWELFDFVIKAGEILGDTSSEMQEIKSAKSKLAGPQVGLAGQFMEWKDEITRDITGDGQHRHVNHLFWLHPGSQIVAGRSAQENYYVEAMKNTLNTRGDGGTGWSKAWKINFWARLRDGDRSHKLVEEILKQSTLYNLFDTHPPFQIDGNFGATAGMTEMLVQSQGNCIEMLPALPQAWNTGSFKGIKARGNFELNAQWENGNLSILEITSNAGNECILKYENIKDFNIQEQGGGSVNTIIINDNQISFETEKGKIYLIAP